MGAVSIVEQTTYVKIPEKKERAEVRDAFHRRHQDDGNPCQYEYIFLMNNEPFLPVPCRMLDRLASQNLDRGVPQAMVAWRLAVAGSGCNYRGHGL